MIRPLASFGLSCFAELQSKPCACFHGFRPSTGVSRRLRVAAGGRVVSATVAGSLPQLEAARAVRVTTKLLVSRSRMSSLHQARGGRQVLRGRACRAQEGLEGL